MMILTAPSSAELVIRNSRFLAEALPVATQEDARHILKERKDKYNDATHVVHAFIVGETGGILGCSDDGEPSGTAGRPVLEVLKGSEITNIIITVTRWFGGIKLGTGGLVKAYTQAAQAVLDGASIIPLVKVRDFSVTLPYDVYEAVKRGIVSLDGEIFTEVFDTNVSLTGQLPEEAAPSLCSLVRDLTRGSVAVVLQEENQTGQKV